MYGCTIVFSAFLGYTVALVNAHLNVFSVKRIKREYLARISGIATAVSVASMPIASFLVSGVASCVKTETIFIVSGLLALVVSVSMFFSKTLEDKEEKTEAMEEAFAE